MSWERKWPLFKIRPKLHIFVHIRKLCRRFSEDLLAMYPIAIPSSPGCSLNLELRKWIEEQVEGDSPPYILNLLCT